MMRKLFVSFLMVVFSVMASAQIIEKPAAAPNKDYLKKAKTQQKVGVALMMTGLTLFVASSVIPKGEVIEEYGPSWLGPGYTVHKNDALKRNLGKAGAVSVLGSIPFLILSSKNKKRAAALSGSVQMEKAPLAPTAGRTTQTFPALAVRWQF